MLSRSSPAQILRGAMPLAYSVKMRRKTFACSSLILRSPVPGV